MDDEALALLKENLQLSQDNNKLLRKMYRSHKLDRFYKFLHFLFTIALFLVAYYFIEPYIKQARDLYNEASLTIQQGKDQVNNFQNLYQ